MALVRRSAVPMVVAGLSFDAGFAADALDTPGTQTLMLGMLDEGTATRDATQIAEQQERLGASIETGGGLDASTVTLSALTANLEPSLELMADIVRNPAFAAGEVARVRDQQLAALSQTLSTPSALARRELGRLLYGAHPYGQPADGLGDATIARRAHPRGPARRARQVDPARSGADHGGRRHHHGPAAADAGAGVRRLAGAAAAASRSSRSTPPFLRRARASC